LMRPPLEQPLAREEAEGQTGLEKTPARESWQEALFALGGVLILISIGLFPGLLLGSLPGMLQAFPLLK